MIMNRAKLLILLGEGLVGAENINLNVNHTKPQAPSPLATLLPTTPAPEPGCPDGLNKPCTEYVTRDTSFQLIPRPAINQYSVTPQRRRMPIYELTFISKVRCKALIEARDEEHLLDKFEQGDFEQEDIEVVEDEMVNIKDVL